MRLLDLIEIKKFKLKKYHYNGNRWHEREKKRDDQKRIT